MREKRVFLVLTSLCSTIGLPSFVHGLENIVGFIFDSFNFFIIVFGLSGSYTMLSILVRVDILV